jgi:heterodisulfide reductase subunit C
VQLLWTENLEGIYDAMQEKIWSCAQCYTCAARCPFGNSTAWSPRRACCVRSAGSC